MAKLLSDEEVMGQASQVDPSIAEYNSERQRNIEEINYSMDFDRKQKGYKGESDVRYTTLMGELKKEQGLLDQPDEDKYFLKQQEYRYTRAQSQARPSVGPAIQGNITPMAGASQGKRRRLLTDEQVGASPRWSAGEMLGQGVYDLVHGKADEAEKAEKAGAPRTLQHPEMEPRERIGIGMDMTKPSFDRPHPGGRIIGRGAGSDMGSLVVAADSIAGMGGQAFKSGVLYPNLYDHFLRTGVPAPEAAKRAQKIAEEMTPDAFLVPFKKIVTSLGMMNNGEVDNSILGRAFAVLGHGMQEGSQAASEGTGGLIPAEHIQEALNAGMNVLGLVGAGVGYARGKAKPEAQRAGPTEGRGATEQAPPATPEQQALPNPALEGEWMPGSRAVDQAREAPFKRPEPDYGVSEPNPDIARLPRNVPRLTLKEAPAEAAQKFLDNHGGAIDPKLLKTMGVGSALVAAGGWMYMNPEEAKRLGVGVGTGLVAAGAIRTTGGGFIHPNAKYFLSQQFNYQYRSPIIHRASDLQRDLDWARERLTRYERYQEAHPGEPSYGAEVARLREEIPAKQAEIDRISSELQTVEDWINKASHKYLARQASTPNDPLKGVKVPPPEWSETIEPMTWEQAMDQVITGHPVREYADPETYAYGPGGGMTELFGARKMPNQEEIVWDTIGGWGQYSPQAAQTARRAIEEYMDKVGEYARNNIPVEDLVRYDFPGLVQRYAKEQEKLAAEALKPAARDRKISPIYRQYPEVTTPTGGKNQLYWQQLDQIGQPTYEGNQMKHSMGGYDPYPARYENGRLIYPAHPDWKEGMPEALHGGPNYGRGGRDAFKTGFVKAYSLRDKSGTSLVTIETAPKLGAEADFWNTAPEEFKKRHPRPRMDPQTEAQWEELDAWQRGILLSPEFIASNQPHGISQIKGFNNKHIKALTDPYVLDFIRSKDWAYINHVDIEDRTPFIKWEGKIATKQEVQDWGLKVLEKFADTPYGKKLREIPENMEGPEYQAWEDTVRVPVLSGASGYPTWSPKDVYQALRNPLDEPSRALGVARAIEHMTSWKAEFNPESPFKNELGKANPELLAWLAVGGTTAALAAYVAGDKKLRAATLAALGVGAFALFSPLRKGMDYTAGMVSTRMGYESPVLKRRLRDFDHHVMARGNEALDEAHPFLKELSKVKGPHRQEIEGALRENDPVKIMQAFRGNRELENAWNTVQMQIHHLGGEYLPASLKDNGLEGLKTTLTPDAATRLDVVIARAEAKKIKDSLKPLSPMEVSMVVDRFIRAQDTSIFKPEFSRGHRGPAMDMMKDLGKYYVSATDNLLRYIGMSVYDKELARFFGGSRKTLKVVGREVTNVNDSILNIVNNGVARGKIKADGAPEAIDILKSRFGPGEESMNPFLQDVRNWTNTGLLGSYHAAATQISDSLMTVYHHGLFPVLEAVARRAGNKHYFTTKEFGLLNHLAEELGSQRFSSRFLHGTFRTTGFKAIDQFAKGVNLNASFIKNSQWAKTKKGRERLYEKYGEAYGDEFELLLDDLRARRKTDRTKSLVFNELADAQAIGKSEMSQAMLDHPNGRLLAQMKHYMLKQIDVIRRDAFDELRKGNYLRGMKNLLVVSAALSLSNVPGEIVKDWLSGRPIDLNIDHVENFLQNFGLNRYTLDKMDRSKNPAEAATEFGMQMVKPPAASVAKELGDAPEGLVKLIPGPGRAIYDRYMGGNERRAKAIEKSKKAKESKEKKKNTPPLSPLEQERKDRRRRERLASLDEEQ